MKLKHLGILAIVLCLILVVIGFVAGGSASKLLPVSPVIVSTRNSSDKSKLTDYIATITADIRNDGGNGEIVIEIKYMEGTQAWTKSTRERFTTNETKSVSLDFPEATLGGEGKYEITAR